MKKCTYCGKEYPEEASVCAIDQQPLVSDIPTPENAPEPVVAEPEEPGEESGEEPEVITRTDVPEGYVSLAMVSSHEAARLLHEFEKEGIPFLIDRIDTADHTGRGIRKASLIEICVRSEDRERAMKIYTKDWQV